ncbi:MAG: HEAT repeat domain-containing protein [Syntrophobacterales bacterium]|jgi:HEAT repeat protein
MKKTLSDTDILLRSQLTDDPHAEIKARLAEFLLALIQAFLRTGYYTPDHPEAQKAKMGLYEDFQGLFSQRDELTFLVREELEGKNILIEGVLPEVQDLNSLMIAGMAEMYVPRFAKFLEQKDLISLTLKNAMTQTEFTSLVDLMSEPAFVDTKDSGAKEEFSQALRERNIFNVSYIYNEELVTARNIPWRSQIALTRLKKDFSMVPFFTDLDFEGLKKVRKQIIQDLIRPLRNAEAIYHILMNSDLAVTKEFKEAEIDEEVLEALADDLLVKVSETLLKETFRDEKTEPVQEKTVTLAKQFASALNLREIKERESILQEYVKHKLISAEQLPKSMQQRFRIERLTKKFLQDSNSLLSQFDKIQDEAKYLQVARALLELIPELIAREEYEAVLEIINCLDRHTHEKEHLSTCAGHILDEISKGETLSALKNKFLIGKMEICKSITPLFLALGGRSVPHLVPILVRSRDLLVRKNAVEIIAQINPTTIGLVLDKLKEKGTETRTMIDILRVLGEIESDEWLHPLANTLLGYLNHESPHIRVEALRVFFKIKTAQGKSLYLDLLNDPDIDVQQEAIHCLARVKSTTALVKFLEMLKNSEDSTSAKTDRLEACLYRALGSYGNLELPGEGSLEDFLLATIKRQLSLGRLSFSTVKGKAIKPETVAAICEALGNVGTRKSRKTLQKLTKQKDSLWQNKAQKALTKIAKREEAAA